MKTLLLIRHAHAGHSNPQLRDKARPLSARGQLEASAVAQRLAQRGFAPDLIVASPAARTIETARLLARALSYRLEDIVPIDRLYECEAVELCEIIEGINDRHENLIIVGHNPALSEFAWRLSEGIEFMAPGAVASFTFTMPRWADIGHTVPTTAIVENPQAQDRHSP